MQHFANVQTRHFIGGEGVLKMFRGRDRRSQGGVSHNDVQIFKHLEEADVDTLIDELAVLTDDAADGNVDLDKINAYLDALDEKTLYHLGYLPKTRWRSFMPAMIC